MAYKKRTDLIRGIRRCRVCRGHKTTWTWDGTIPLCNCDNAPKPNGGAKP